MNDMETRVYLEEADVKKDFFDCKENNLKCPFCQQELEINDLDVQLLGCENQNCKHSTHYDTVGTKELWQELIRTRKALDYAIGVIQTVAKMSDKLSKEYGETLVEQLDNIQAYCWQEGYVLTHKEDLERAITALEQKDVK